jgi:hypothetical protein
MELRVFAPAPEARLHQNSGYRMEKRSKSGKLGNQVDRKDSNQTFVDLMAENQSDHRLSPNVR